MAKVNFLDLPTELRLIIYNFALTDPNPIRIEERFFIVQGKWSRRLEGTVPFRGPMNFEVRMPVRHALAPALLLTSRLLYTEASPVLWKTNTFFFAHLRAFTRFCDGVCQSRASTAFNSIRNMQIAEIRLGTPCSALTGLACFGDQLNTVALRFFVRDNVMAAIDFIVTLMSTIKPWLDRSCVEAKTTRRPQRPAQPAIMPPPSPPLPPSPMMTAMSRMRKPEDVLRPLRCESRTHLWLYGGPIGARMVRKLEWQAADGRVQKGLQGLVASAWVKVNQVVAIKKRDREDDQGDDADAGQSVAKRARD